MYKIKRVYDMFMILQDQHLIHILEHVFTFTLLMEGFRTGLKVAVLTKNLNKNHKLESNDISSVP